MNNIHDTEHLDIANSIGESIRMWETNGQHFSEEMFERIKRGVDKYGIAYATSSMPPEMKRDFINLYRGGNNTDEKV